MKSAFLADETFESLGLDKRVLLALLKHGFEHPTVVQKAVLAHAREGKDILTRAATGSGKTLSYVIPIVDSLLKLHSAEGTFPRGIKAVVLLPSQELCVQVHDVFTILFQYCADVLSMATLSAETSNTQLRQILASRPDILITTPGKLASLLKGKAREMLNEGLRFFIVDEADLLLSYGYGDDISAIMQTFSTHVQSFVMSATLSDDVETLKGLILHNPVHVKLEEAEEELESRLSQFYLLSNDEEEKFLHLYTLLKFKLLPGKALIFVNDIDQCYRLKLFLDRFSIRVAVLNADLPLGARLHIVNQFSRGVFDYLIATDDSISEEEEAAALDSSHKGKGKPKGKGKKRPSVHAARGIDFRDVESVVLFDLPRTVIEYVHRIGRTARAGASGSAVTLIAKEERDSFDAIYRAVEEGGREIRPFAINTEEADAFRYRVGDAYRSVTKLQIKEARATDLKREILQAAKMNQEVDSSNTDALDALKHDAPIPTTRSFSHLKNVPSYLNPTGLVMSETAMIVQQTAAANEARKRERLERTVTYAKPSKRPRTGGQAKRGPSGKRRDPLKSMK